MEINNKSDISSDSTITLMTILTDKYKTYIANGSYQNKDVQKMYSDGVTELKSTFMTAQNEDLNILSHFQKLQAYVKQYSITMEKRFSCYFIFSDEKLTKFHEMAIAAIDVDERNEDLLQYAFKEYFKHYSERNVAIQIHESEILTTIAIPKILKFYQAEFLLHNKFISHDALKKQCIDTIKRCFFFNDEHLMILKHPFAMLDKLLDDVNKKLVTELNYKENAFTFYTESMQNKLKLKTHTESELSHTAKYLFENIDWSEEESQIFQSRLETSFLTIKAENDKFISKTPPTQHEIYKEKSHSPTDKNHAETRIPLKPHRNSRKSPILHNRLPPPEVRNPVLSIEFGIDEIKSGIIINNNFILIPIDSENATLSTEVGLSAEDRVLIGSEAHQRCKTNFHLKTLLQLTPKELNSPPEIYFTSWNRKMNVKKELLIALLFSEIKMKAQKFLKTSINDAVISVPLWFMTTERLAIKQSASIAGFKNVKLITEPTAAAIQYFDEMKRDGQIAERVNSPPSVITLVAKSGHYDMAIYQMIERNQIVMIKCAGDRHSKRKQSYRNILSHLQKFLLERNIPVQNMVSVGFPDALKAAEGQGIRHREISNSVILGAAKYATCLTNNTEMNFTDLYPYKIKVKKHPRGGICRKTLAKFKREGRLNGQQNISWVHKRPQVFCLDVHELGVRKLCSGFFKIDAFCPERRRVSANVNKEGILSILVNKDEEVCNAYNLNAPEKATYVSFVEFESKCREIEYFATSFLHDSSRLNLNEILKIEIMGEVQNSLDLLSNYRVSDEVVSATLEMLRGLNDKYFKI